MKLLVPKGSTLGPLLFFIYVNDVQMAVKCNLFSYANDTCLVFQGDNAKHIEKQLNQDFQKKCNWFVDNKVSICFEDDKTKFILFASIHKIKKLPSFTLFTTVFK